MEYTFKNSFQDKPITISLKPFSMVVQKVDSEKKISFARVNSIHLSRRGGFFKATIEVQDGPDIVVTNRYYLSSTDFEDRSSAYATFIRALHHQLKDKSDAVFTTGFSYNAVLLGFLFICFVAFLVSFVAEFLGFRIVNSFLLAILISVVGVSLLMIYQRGKISKQYNPTDIPLRFLP